MTKKEIKIFIDQKKKLAKQKRKIKELTAKTVHITPNYTNIHVQNSTKDNTVNINRLIDEQAKYSKMELDFIVMYIDMVKFIENIPDIRARLLFRFKVLDGKNNNEISRELNRTIKADSVCTIFKRAVRKYCQ